MPTFWIELFWKGRMWKTHSTIEGRGRGERLFCLKPVTSAPPSFYLNSFYPARPTSWQIYVIPISILTIMETLEKKKLKQFKITFFCLHLSCSRIRLWKVNNLTRRVYRLSINHNLPRGEEDVWTERPLDRFYPVSGVKRSKLCQRTVSQLAQFKQARESTYTHADDHERASVASHNAFKIVSVSSLFLHWNRGLN